MSREFLQRSIMDQSYVASLIGKYDRMLVGIPSNNRAMRGYMAMLYENQANHLGDITEDLLTANVGSYLKYIFPTIARVFPNLIAPRIISVQPMSSPIGGVFKREFVYEDEKGNGTTGTAGKNLVQTFAKHYTSEYVDYALVVAAASVDGTKTDWTGSTNAGERISLKWLPVRPFNAAAGYSAKFFYTQGGSLRTLTDDGAGILRDTGGTQRGTINYTDGTFTLTLAAAPTAATPIFAAYYYDSEKVRTTPNAKIPQGRMEHKLLPIHAKTRKFRMAWSAEAVDDMRAIHGSDAEADLVAAWGNEMMLELDREIIDMLTTNAAWSASWTHSASWGGANTHNELESIRHFQSILGAVSAKIHTETKRGNVNFLVVPPGLGNLLGQLKGHGDFVPSAPEWAQQPSFGGLTSNFGTQFLGTLSGRIAVYQDPYMDPSKALCGLQADSMVDAGAVYAPYVPLYFTDTWEDPRDFTNHKGARHRYALEMLRNEWYGVINISGLPSVGGAVVDRFANL